MLTRRRAMATLLAGSASLLASSCRRARRKNTRLQPGDLAELDSRQPIPVSESLSTLREYLEAARGDDEAKCQRMVQAGLVTMARTRTRVQVGHMAGDASRCKILAGDLNGKHVWVPKRAVAATR